MTRLEAIRLRRPNEMTVKRIKHDELCLFSDGTIIPKYPCTCGSKKISYNNVLKQ